MECTSTGAVRYSHLVMRLTRRRVPRRVTTMPPATLPDATVGTPTTRTPWSTCTCPAARARAGRRPGGTRCTAGSGSRSGTAGTPGRWRGRWPTWAGWWRRRSTAGCGGGGGWPVTGDDVRRAVRRLPELLGRARRRHRTARGDRPLGGRAPRALAGHARALPIDRVVALAPVVRPAARRSGSDLGDGATAALLGGADPAVADPMVLLDGRPGVRGRGRARRRRRRRTGLTEPGLGRAAPVGRAPRGAGRPHGADHARVGRLARP